jgi:hypothetical protein
MQDRFKGTLRVRLARFELKKKKKVNSSLFHAADCALTAAPINFCQASLRLMRNVTTGRDSKVKLNNFNITLWWKTLLDASCIMRLEHCQSHAALPTKLRGATMGSQSACERSE